MRFEQAIDIGAPQQRVWDVLSDLQSWPQRIETVDEVELLTPAPVAVGSRVRLKQPKLGQATYEVTAWDPPSSFELRQKSFGVSTVAGHRVEAPDEGRSRLTLTLELSGVLVPIFGRMFKGLTADYMATEARDLKRAAESGS
jgi:carbon monoxide dehydrogenase subunit G